MKYLLFSSIFLVSCVTPVEYVPVELPPLVNEVTMIKSDLLVSLHKPECPTDRGTVIVSHGTKTKIGEAVVTSLHIENKCNLTGTYSSELDIFVLKPGETGPCKNVKLHESVKYLGYPLLDNIGVPFMPPVMEKDIGASISLGIQVWQYSSDPEDTGSVIHPNMDKGTHSGLIRGGYSGGAVVSQEDGRVVGIIASSNEDTVIWTPVEPICDLIEENK